MKREGTPTGHRRPSRRQFIALTATGTVAVAAGATAVALRIPGFESSLPAPTPPTDLPEAAASQPAQPDTDFDLVIVNGTVIDGTGRPRFRADVGLRAGRIAAVSRGGGLSGRQKLDAGGLIVAPGFIDAHSHLDWILPSPQHPQILAPFLAQGVTTLVTGNCGSSPAFATGAGTVTGSNVDVPIDVRWRSFGEFLDVLDRDGVMLNSAFLVGHGNVRSMVMGQRAGVPSTQEMQTMLGMVRDAMRQGAFGFSVGLAYAPGVFAKNEELLEFLKVVAVERGIFTAHTGGQSWVSGLFQPMFFTTEHNVRATRELIDLSKQTGVRFQNSHLIFVGRNTWRTYATQLRDIENAKADGLDIAFDAYPYTAGDSVINVIFPAWFLDNFPAKVNDPASLSKLEREITIQKLAVGLDFGDLRLKRIDDPELSQYEGLDFAKIADRLKMRPFDAYIHVARRSGGKARIMLGTYSGDANYEEPLRAVLKHSLCSFMTDANIGIRGAANPAAYGTYPRLLGKYSRDLKLFSLEEAVRRMTAYSADRFGLQDTGRVAEGQWGDIVLFDPATVADNTTPEHASAAPAGIRAVLVSGEVVARDGQVVNGKPKGRVLRYRA